MELLIDTVQIYSKDFDTEVKNIDDIIGIIINAVKQGTLDKVFITQKFIEY